MNMHLRKTFLFYFFALFDVYWFGSLSYSYYLCNDTFGKCMLVPLYFFPLSFFFICNDLVKNTQKTWAFTTFPEASHLQYWMHNCFPTWYNHSQSEDIECLIYSYEECDFGTIKFHSWAWGSSAQSCRKRNWTHEQNLWLACLFVCLLIACLAGMFVYFD